MQLQRLTGLERQKILGRARRAAQDDRAAARDSRERPAADADHRRRAEGRFGKATATTAAREIIDESGELTVEDLIAEEDMAITVSNTGYIKRTAITTYRSQRRGGKGRIGMRTREEDFVSHLFVASTHAYIMIFSDRGRAYWLKVHEIPDVGPGGKGKSIANLVSMEEGERIAAMLAGQGVRGRQVHRHGLAAGASSRRRHCRRSATRAPAASSPWVSKTATR